MTGKTLSALALAGIAAAALATAALAEKTPGAGPGDGPVMQLRFDELDADKDGKVTEAEIQAWHDARFAAADADKNGLLSPEELTAMQAARMQERLAARSQKMIERLDGNGDGQLSAEELAQMGKRQTPFQRADADGDGGVSKEEAQAAMGKAGKHGKHGKRGHDRDRGHDRGGWWWNID